MQRTVSCRRCRCPNPLGQQFCGSCGEKLIPDCPYCGSPCTGSYFCAVCGKRLSGAPPQDEGPLMHILALDQCTGHVVGLASPHSPVVMLPAITTDGRLSMLDGGSMNDFNRFQHAVIRKIKKLNKDYKSFVCVATCITSMDKMGKAGCLVWDIVGSFSQVSEMQTVHDLLAELRVSGDEYWTKVENFFSTEPQKSFINALITHLMKEINWSWYVEQVRAKAKL